MGYKEEDIDENINDRGALGTNLIFPSFFEVPQPLFEDKSQGREVSAIGSR